MSNLKNKKPSKNDNKTVSNNSNIENSFSQDEAYWESTITFFKMLPFLAIVLLIVLIKLCKV